MPTRGFIDSTTLSKHFCHVKSAWHHKVMTTDNQTQAAQVIAWDAHNHTHDLKNELL